MEESSPFTTICGSLSVNCIMIAAFVCCSRTCLPYLTINYTQDTQPTWSQNKVRKEIVFIIVCESRKNGTLIRICSSWPSAIRTVNCTDRHCRRTTTRPSTGYRKLCMWYKYGIAIDQLLSILMMLVFCCTHLHFDAHHSIALCALETRWTG